MLRFKSRVCLLTAAMVLAAVAAGFAQEFARRFAAGSSTATRAPFRAQASRCAIRTRTKWRRQSPTPRAPTRCRSFARRYEMTVELQGFQKHTRSGMVLQVNETATINVELAVGGVTEVVSVTAESPLLETSNASRGTVIDAARVAELPLQSRSPMALATLVAGVTYNAQAIYLRPSTTARSPTGR